MLMCNCFVAWWVRDSSAGAGRGVTELTDPERGRRGRHVLRGDGDADTDSHVVQGRTRAGFRWSRDDRRAPCTAARPDCCRWRSVHVHFQQRRRLRVAPYQTRHSGSVNQVQPNHLPPHAAIFHRLLCRAVFFCRLPDSLSPSKFHRISLPGWLIPVACRQALETCLILLWISNVSNVSETI